MLRQAADVHPKVHQRRDGADHAEAAPVQGVAPHEQGADVPALGAADLGAAVGVGRTALRAFGGGKLGFGALGRPPASWPPAPAQERPQRPRQRPAGRPVAQLGSDLIPLGFSTSDPLAQLGQFRRPLVGQRPCFSQLGGFPLLQSVEEGRNSPRRWRAALAWVGDA